MKIEQHQLDTVKAMGACSDRLRAYKAGMDISEIAYEDAVWVENNVPELVADFEMPLWTMVGSGSGYGDGDGYGYGDGYGSGSEN